MVEMVIYDLFSTKASELGMILAYFFPGVLSKSKYV